MLAWRVRYVDGALERGLSKAQRFLACTPRMFIQERVADTAGDCNDLATGVLTFMSYQTTLTLVLNTPFTVLLPIFTRMASLMRPPVEPRVRTFGIV